MNVLHEEIFIKYVIFCFLTSILVILWLMWVFSPCSILQLVYTMVSSSFNLSTLPSTHYLKNKISSHKTFTHLFFKQGDKKQHWTAGNTKKWGICYWQKDQL